MSNQHDSVLMIGWEYPPHNSGGLGVACEGMTHALAEQNTEIFFTLPYQHAQAVGHMHVVECTDPSWQLQPGQTPFLAYSSQRRPPTVAPVDADSLHALPQSELELRVKEYAAVVQQAAQQRQDGFAVIHAHDWMSLPAAVEVKAVTGRPIVAHVHSTEYDRIPSGFGSPFIIQTEQQGLALADTIIAVSHYTKRLLVEKYHLDERKIQVVHNGVAPLARQAQVAPFAQNRPVVVFMGRLTQQKGAEYFLQLAHRLLQQVPEALFVVAGHGDMYHELLFKTAFDKLSASVLFSGFLRDTQRERLLARADVFVMPSLSEPFGLVALEAAQRRTPVILSKNTGVAEVLSGALTIDFWDIDKMVQAIIELLDNKGFHRQVVQQQFQDLAAITWSKSAQQIKEVYRRVLSGT